MFQALREIQLSPGRYCERQAEQIERYHSQQPELRLGNTKRREGREQRGEHLSLSNQKPERASSMKVAQVTDMTVLKSRLKYHLILADQIYKKSVHRLIILLLLLLLIIISIIIILLLLLLLLLSFIIQTRVFYWKIYHS